MLFTLAFASLARHRARTILAVLGVAVSAAVLLGMGMLSTGMRESFRSLLLAQGFQLRIAPRGTLPFDTEATIRDADALVAMLRALPSVDRVSPVLGGQLHIPTASGAVTSAALGLEPAVQGDYELVEGRHPSAGDELVANDALLHAIGRRIGDTVSAAAGYDPQFRGLSGVRVLRLVGRVRFVYMAAEQRGAALPLATLRAMQGADATDRMSLAMVRLRPGVDADSTRAVVERLLPRVTVVSTSDAI